MDSRHPKNNDATEAHRRDNGPMNVSGSGGRLILLLASISIFCLGARAAGGKRVTGDHHPWWVTVGGGPSLIGGDFSMSAGMIYTYQFENSVISGRILGITNINPTVQKIAPVETNYKMADYGVLYGPIWHYGRSYVSLGAGLGLVRASRQSGAQAARNTSISLPVEAQWFWQPTGFAGFGMYAYASANFERPLYGLLLCAQLGAW
jgi:hypothetical protein